MEKSRKYVQRPQQEIERDDVKIKSNRCPFCHEDIQIEGSDWVACRSCQGRHHQACWEELGGCGSCREKRFVADVSQLAEQASPVVSEVSAEQAPAVVSEVSDGSTVIRLPRIALLLMVCITGMFGSFLTTTTSTPLWLAIAFAIALISTLGLYFYSQWKAGIKIRGWN
jgi:hypothetical protein